MRLTLLVLLLIAPAAYGQGADTPVLPPDSSAAAPASTGPYVPRRIWGSVELGPASHGVGGSLNFAHRLGDRQFVELRLTSEQRGFFGSGDSTQDYGVLYGTILEARHGAAALSAGAALVTGTRYDPLPDGTFGFTRRTFQTVGLPVSARAYFTPARHAGLSLHVFANLNPVTPFAGAALGVMLGDF